MFEWQKTRGCCILYSGPPLYSQVRHGVVERKAICTSNATIIGLGYIRVGRLVVMGLQDILYSLIDEMNGV